MKTLQNIDRIADVSAYIYVYISGSSESVFMVKFELNSLFKL